MTLKNAGRVKKPKLIKCDKCKNKVEIIDDEIIKIDGVKYIYCPYCGQDILL